MQNQSEVARIRQQIADEYEAANRIFNEPAIVSSHEIIERRQENLAAHFEALTKHMSKDEAIKVFFEVAKGKKE